jgi:hypothetical protein
MIKKLVGGVILLVDLWVGTWALYNYGSNVWPGLPILLTAVLFLAIAAALLVEDWT